MSALATVLIAMKDLADAESATRDALKAHGPDHPVTARALETMRQRGARCRVLLHTHAGSIPVEAQEA